MSQDRNGKYTRALIRSVIVIVVFFMGTPLVWPGNPPRSQLTFDEFKVQITDAYQHGNTQKIRQLSTSHVDFLRPLVDELVRDCFRSDLQTQGKKAEDLLSFARAIAKLKKEITRDNLLVNRVNRYRSWSLPERMLKSEADRLLTAAARAFNEGLYGEVAAPGKKALDLYGRLSDTAGEADTLHYLGQAERKLANYDEAVKMHDRALQLAKKDHDRTGQGQALVDLGDVYERRKDHAKAIESYERALASLSPEEDWREMGRALCQLGDIYVASGDFGAAHESYSRALQFAEKGRDPVYIARFSDYLGYFYRQLGDYDKAIEIHKEALENAGRIADAAMRAQARARALNHLGLCTEKLAEWSSTDKGSRPKATLYRDAIAYERQALEYAVEINDRWRQGYIMRALSQLHRELGAVLPDGEKLPQYQLSLEWADRALELASSSMGEKEWTGLALNHTFLAQAALRRDEECLQTFQRSVALWESMGDLLSMGRAYHLLAQSFYEPRSRYEDALAAYDQAIRIYARIHALEYMAAIHLNKGAIYEKQGEIEKAKAAYMASIETMESMRSKLTSEEHKLTFFARRSKPYEALISLLIKGYRKQSRLEDGIQAFYVSEQAKAKTFQEMLAKASARRAIGQNNPKLRQYVSKERELIDRLAQCRNLLTEALNRPEARRDYARIRDIEEDAIATETQLISLERDIEKNFPEYADLKTPRLKTIKELQENILRPDEIVVSYFITGENLVAWAISAKNVHIAVTDIKSSDLKNRIRSLKNSLEEVGRTGNPRDLNEFNVRAANELYRILIRPVEEYIRGAQIVYISGHDVLYTLPFEVLIKDGPNTAELIRKYENITQRRNISSFDYVNLPYLLKDHPIAYLPSVSVLYSVRTFLKDGYGKWREPLVAFADPVFCPRELKKKGKDAFLNRGANFALFAMRGSGTLTDSDPCKVLPRLSATADEVKAIARTLKAPKKPFLREEAKETALKTIDLRPYRYVTIATHGLLAGEFKVNQPSLVLSLVGDGKNDGLLEMDEVLGLDIHAELVTLSACNTSAAEGGTDKGEGFVGLTRSFMFAGTPSVLVTHWSVESETTRDLMIKVHQMITAKGRARALRDAKIDMIGRYVDIGETRISTAHPFFWGGFVIVGDGR